MSERLTREPLAELREYLRRKNSGRPLGSISVFAEWDAALAAQEVELTRLREALQKIAVSGYVKTGVSGYKDAATSGDPRMEGLADIARAALLSPNTAKENE